MAEAVAEKSKIKDEEFDIHGDLAVSEASDKSFVVLYDSTHVPADAKTISQPSKNTEHEELPLPPAPSLDELNEHHALETPQAVHGEDAYIDDILSSDDIEPATHAVSTAHHDDDGPIALSNEELDGILEMGPTSDEEFHPDFPVDKAHHAADTVPTAAEPVHTEHNYHNDHATPHTAADEDELPIALSDEDLDEILLEEEGHSSPNAASTHNVLPHAPVQSSAPELVDEEEPIALSDDELDHILADAEAEQPATHAINSNEHNEAEDEVLTLDGESELTLIDDAAPTSETKANNFFDNDAEEDEPITLSDEELDGILSTAPEETVAAPSEEVALAELPPATTLDVEDEEPIALSNEELDGILVDAHEAPEVESELHHEEGLAELPPAIETEEHDNKGFFDADEDEPIALSADELDGIAATATTEDEPHVPPTEPQDDATMAMDERYTDVDHMSTADEDEGPIALSNEELDGIAADAHEVTPEAPMMPLAPHDASASEPSLAESTDKPATVFEEDLEAATLIHEDDKAAAAPAPETEELKSVMGYLDNLLGELPDDVIEKFAQSEYFKLYQKIMDKLGI